MSDSTRTPAGSMERSGSWALRTALSVAAALLCAAAVAGVTALAARTPHADGGFAPDGDAALYALGR